MRGFHQAQVLSQGLGMAVFSTMHGLHGASSQALSYICCCILEKTAEFMQASQLSPRVNTVWVVDGKLNQKVLFIASN